MPRTKQTARKITGGFQPRHNLLKIEVDIAKENDNAIVQRFRRLKTKQTARKITGGFQPRHNLLKIEDDIAEEFTEEVKTTRTGANEATAAEAEQPKHSNLEAKEEVCSFK